MGQSGTKLKTVKETIIGNTVNRPNKQTKNDKKKKKFIHCSHRGKRCQQELEDTNEN